MDLAILDPLEIMPAAIMAGVVIVAFCWLILETAKNAKFMPKESDKSKDEKGTES